MFYTLKNNHRPIDPDVKLISLPEYAKLKFVDSDTVLYWIRKQKIRAWKIFGRWYIENLEM